ncbi:hypothetical protein C4K08_1507 [Pseudomonas chlororaphis subsp. aureofaciens]|nr:hypothetical protein C4K08_1507 [Pseudomonas chlororaphis subsp. aureofaciens]
MSIPSLFLTQHDLRSAEGAQRAATFRSAPNARPRRTGEPPRARKKPHCSVQLRSPVYPHFILKRSQESLS